MIVYLIITFESHILQVILILIFFQFTFIFRRNYQQLVRILFLKTIPTIVYLDDHLNNSIIIINRTIEFIVRIRLSIVIITIVDIRIHSLHPIDLDQVVHRLLHYHRILILKNFKQAVPLIVFIHIDQADAKYATKNMTIPFHHHHLHHFNNIIRTI